MQQQLAVAAAAPTNDGNQPENADTRPPSPNHDWPTLLRCKSLVTLPKRCCCSFSLLNKTAATLLLATSLPPPLPCQHNTLTFFFIPAKNLLAQSSTEKKMCSLHLDIKKLRQASLFQLPLLLYTYKGYADYGRRRVAHRKGLQRVIFETSNNIVYEF